MKKKLLCTILALVLLLSVFPTAFAQNQYAYSLDQLRLTDLRGNTIANPQGSCMASVQMTKTDSSRTAVDTLVVCAYSTTGELIAFNLMQSYMDSAESRQFGSYINVPKGQLLGEVRAFVWESLDTMMPLSSTVSLVTNDGAVSPIPQTYTVKGYLTDTSRTSGMLTGDLARFTIESSENFDGQRIDINSPVQILCDIGTSDLVQYPGLYVTAEIEKTDNDTYKLVSYTPDSRQTIVDTTISLFDDYDYEVFYGNTYVADPYVRFYPTADTTRATIYPLNRDLTKVILYVNGAYVAMNEYNFSTYVVHNKYGDIRLVDKYDPGYGTDGFYDSIYVTYHVTAMVDGVTTTTGKVSFSKASPGVNSSVMLNAGDSRVTFHIYMNDTEISIDELKNGDVLSIAYEAGAGFQNSLFYDIYVSRDTATGQYTSYNSSTKTFNIGGVDYEFTEGTFASNQRNLILGESYTMHLDVFGRIFHYDMIPAPINYAIFDKFAESLIDDCYKAVLFLPDGTTQAYEVDTRKVEVDGYTGASLNDYLLTKLYNDTNCNSVIDGAEKTNSNKVAIEKRVIEYKINSADKLVSLSFVPGTPGAGTMISPLRAAYDKGNQTVGSIRMGDATRVIDATIYMDKDNQTSYLRTVGISAFADGVEYMAFAYGDRFSDGTYPLVLATAGSGAYTEDTRFAVVVDTPSRGTVDGESIYWIDVIYGGDEITLTTVDDADLEINGCASVSSLDQGDIIVFQYDTKNRVKQIDLLFKGSYAIGDYMYDTIAYLLVVGNTAYAIEIPEDVDIVTVSGMEFPKWTTDWDLRIPGQNIQLVAGPIIEKNTGHFTIGKIASGPIDSYYGLYTNIDNDETASDGVLKINFSDDTKVAVYDYYMSMRARLAAGTTSDIVASVINDANMIGADGNIIPWDNVATADSTINFAFAKVVDGIATDVFVIRAK